MGNSKGNISDNQDKENKENSTNENGTNKEEKEADSSRGTSLSGQLTKVLMEEKLNSIFSGIGVKGFPLCDAESYSYEKETEGWFYSTITIEKPKVTIEEYKKQIVDANCGIEDCGYGGLGKVMGVKAGTNVIGFTISGEENEFTLWLTNYEKEYTSEYIKAQEAKMPKLIAGTSAMELMPESFTITLKRYSDTVTTFVKSGGDWYEEYITTAEDGSTSYHNKKAILLQPDGSRKIYEASNYSDMKWSTPDNFSDENFADFLEQYFDEDGWDIGFSTWLQVCKDFNENATVERAQNRINLDKGTELVGKETIGEAECDVTYYEGIWFYSEFVYDPDTGVLFRYRTGNQKNEDGSVNWETQWDVMDYKESADRSLFPEE